MNYVEKMLQDYCPNGVEWKELGEVSSFYGGLTGKNKSDFENGNAKYVTYKNIFSNIQVDPSLLETVSVTSDEKQNSIEYGDILITGSSESKEEAGMSSAVTFYPDNKIYLNSFSFGIRFNSDFELLPEFSKYLFRSYTFRKQIEKTASGVTRYNISKVAFKKIKVPVLPKKIQEEIVKILDKFTGYVTELTAELTAELTDRQKQYSFYRDKLLSFEDEVYQVEWKTLGEVAENLDYLRKPVTKGSRSSGIYPYYGASGIVDYVDDYIFDGDYLLVSEDGANLIARKTPIAFSVTGKSWINNHAHVLKFESDIDRKYVSYYLNHIDLTPYISGAAQPKLNQQNLNSIKLAYPKQEVRNKIVQVLDNFDAVCNDLSIGLPKEIELRQKQYEYFREKLLTFTAEGVYPGQWTVSGDRPT
ncbi:TPA: restriction endonuclease subunit S [Streptococcus suis]|nr:restriction endonuclease subunit S [Streptococcus suis]